MGSSGVAPRHDLYGFAPAGYCLMSFPWRRDRPGQPPATQRDIRHWGALRGTAGFHCGANRVLAVSAGPVGGRMPAIYACKSLRVLSARALPEAIA